MPSKVFPINFFSPQTPYDLANIFCSSMSKGSESLSEILCDFSNLPRHQRSIEVCWIVFVVISKRKLAMCTLVCCLVDKSRGLYGSFS